MFIIRKNNIHIGLLILRIGIGAVFIFHGYPLMFGGVDVWMQLGKALGTISIESLPVFWGFMAAFSEFFGGIFIIFGLFFRPACLLLIVTMLFAMLFHFDKGDSFTDTSHAMMAAIVFLSLFFTGAGKYHIGKF